MGVGDRTLTSEVGSRVEARWEQLLWGGSLGAWGGWGGWEAWPQTSGWCFVTSHEALKTGFPCSVSAAAKFVFWMLDDTDMDLKSIDVFGYMKTFEKRVLIVLLVMLASSPFHSSSCVTRCGRVGHCYSPWGWAPFAKWQTSPAGLEPGIPGTGCSVPKPGTSRQKGWASHLKHVIRVFGITCMLLKKIRFLWIKRSLAQVNWYSENTGFFSPLPN